MALGLTDLADLRSMALSMILPNSRKRPSWLRTDGSGRVSDRHKGGNVDFPDRSVFGWEIAVEMLAIGFPLRLAWCFQLPGHCAARIDEKRNKIFLYRLVSSYAEP